MLEQDVRCNWQVMPLNMHRSVFPISYLCLITCIIWKLQVVYVCSTYQKTALLSETFLVWFRVSWEIRLESYGSRHASVILWYNIVCLYCKPVHALLFLCNYTWKQNSCTLWLHTMHQTTALPQTTYHFIRANLDSYTTHCSGFQWIVHINIKLLRGTTLYTSLWLCCQAAKKEHKLGIKILCKNELQVGMGL